MTGTKNDAEKRFEEICRFVIKLGVLAHGWGPQAWRLESCLSRVTKALGHSGVFSSEPNCVRFAFKKDGELWDRISVVPVPSPGFNLARLAKAGELAGAVERGEINLPEAERALDRISAAAPPFGRLAVASGYALCGAGFAGFLRGGWPDIIFSALLSVMVFSIVTAMERAPERLAQWTPFLCALAAGVLAALINFFIPETRVCLIILSAVIYLIPGFSISVGIIELTVRHTVSGLTNLTNGLICLALLFAGAWPGLKLAAFLSGPVSAAAPSVPSGLEWLFAMLLAAGLCVVFQTPRRDLLWALTGCALANGGMLLGECLLGVNSGNFLGTAAAIIFANIWSEKTGRPVSIALLPAIVFLVSGSIGFRGLVSISAGDTALGFQEFFHMFAVALSIALGLAAGNSVYKPQIML